MNTDSPVKSPPPKVIVRPPVPNKNPQTRTLPVPGVPSGAPLARPVSGHTGGGVELRPNPTLPNSSLKEKRNSFNGATFQLKPNANNNYTQPTRVLPSIPPGSKSPFKPTNQDNEDKTTTNLQSAPRVNIVKQPSNENVSLGRSADLKPIAMNAVISNIEKIHSQRSGNSPPVEDKGLEEKRRMIAEKIKSTTSVKVPKPDEAVKEIRGHRRTFSQGESTNHAISKPSNQAILSQLQKMNIKPTEISEEVASCSPENNNISPPNSQPVEGNMDNNKALHKESKDKEEKKEKKMKSTPKKTSKFASKLMNAVNLTSALSTQQSEVEVDSNSQHISVHNKDYEQILTSGQYLKSKQIATSFLLSNLLEVIGLNEQQTQDIFEKIQLFTSNGLIDNYTNREISLLSNISKSSQNIIQKFNDAKHIVTIQALCRGFLVRNRLKKLVGNNFKRRIQFNQTFASFIEKEENYIKSLKILIERYLTPVRARMAMGKEVIKLEDMSFIFCNIETILEIHQKNLRQLKAVLDDWPFIRNVGKVILDIGPSLYAYGIYVSNFKNAQDTINRLKAEKNSKYNAWVNEIITKYSDTVDLLTLISLPVNHIARIEPTIEDLAQLMSGQAGDQLSTEQKIEIENLNNAWSMIRETSKFVTQNCLHSDTAIIHNIQRRVIGYSKPLNLVKPDRKFMLEGAFQNLNDGHKKKIYLFLFNDILLITSPQKSLFKFKDLCLLDLVQYEDSSDKSSFVLKTPNDIYKLSTKSTEDKQQWVKALSSLEESRKVNRTIGVSISDILDRESATNPNLEIPSILTQCIEHIENNDGINTEGLFRISGEQREINLLVDLFDTIAGDHDLSSYSIHSICGVLKLWFRELPDPLLTFALYDKLVEIERKTSDDDDRGINQFREVVATLPKCHINSLNFLLQFLSKVCQNSNVNKMTTNNMAIVFGPTLLRPLNETIETTLNSPIVNRIVQLFIEKYEELF